MSKRPSRRHLAFLESNKPVIDDLLKQMPLHFIGAAGAQAEAKSFLTQANATWDELCRQYLTTKPSLRTTKSNRLNQALIVDVYFVLHLLDQLCQLDQDALNQYSAKIVTLRRDLGLINTRTKKRSTSYYLDLNVCEAQFSKRFSLVNAGRPLPELPQSAHLDDDGYVTNDATRSYLDAVVRQASGESSDGSDSYERISESDIPALDTASYEQQVSAYNANANDANPFSHDYEYDGASHFRAAANSPAIQRDPVPTVTTRMVALHEFIGGDRERAAAVVLTRMPLYGNLSTEMPENVRRAATELSSQERLQRQVDRDMYALPRESQAVPFLPVTRDDSAIEDASRSSTPYQEAVFVATPPQSRRTPSAVTQGRESTDSGLPGTPTPTSFARSPSSFYALGGSRRSISAQLNGGLRGAESPNTRSAQANTRRTSIV